MNAEQSNLVLQATKLLFDGKKLTRLTDTGTPCLELPAEVIQSARYSMGFSWFGVVCLIAATLITVIAFTVAQGAVLTTFTLLIAIAAGGLGLLGIVQDKIVLETTHGKVVICSQDKADVTRGFAASLAEQLKHH